MKNKAGLSRREFLKSAAAAAITAHIGIPAFAQEKVEGLNLAIIGAGGQGSHVLMPAAKRAGCRFLAVCDIRPDNRERALRMAEKGAKGYEDYRKLLDEMADKLDAVIIAVPLWKHAEVTIAAFEAGLNVFCEKTMAYDLEQCKAMLRAQRKAGKILQIGHHLRYHPTYHHAKKAYIEKGLLGEITFVHAHWNRNASWRRPVPDSIKNMDFTKWGYPDAEHLVNWRLYKELSGGLMTELASHQTDVVNWMLDKTPVAATGVGGIDYYKDGRTVYDNVHVVFEYPGGIKFHVESLTTNAFSMFGEQVEIIKGTKGTLILSNVPKPYGLFVLERGAREEIWMAAAEKITIGDHAEKATEVRVRDRDAIILDASATQDPEGPRIADIPLYELVDKGGWPKKTTYELEMLEFVQSVRKGLKPTCDGEVGIRSAAPAIIANQAMARQERVEVPKDAYVY